MIIKRLSFLLLSLVLLISACSPLTTIVSSSGEQPAPVEASDPASSGFQSIAIEHVGIQIGVGSPILVEVVASGTWPDLCSQIASVESRMDGFNIDISVLASSVENCRPDNLGLPFRFAIPLNTVEMSDGTYTITVNGTSTTLDLPPSP